MHVFMVILVCMCVPHIIINSLMVCLFYARHCNKNQIIIKSSFWPKYLCSPSKAWDSHVSFTSKSQVDSKLSNSSECGFGFKQSQRNPDFKSCLLISTMSWCKIFSLLIGKMRVGWPLSSLPVRTSCGLIIKVSFLLASRSTLFTL